MKIPTIIHVPFSSHSSLRPCPATGFHSALVLYPHQQLAIPSNLSHSPHRRTIAHDVVPAQNPFSMFFEKLVPDHLLNLNSSILSLESILALPLSKPPTPLLHYLCCSCNLTMVYVISQSMSIFPASAQAPLHRFPCPG